MEIYHKEKLMLEKKMQLAEIAKYLNEKAQKQEAHEIEETLFKKLMEIGGNLFKAAIEKKNKSYKKIEKNQKEEVKFHGKKRCNYQSIFGKISINRSYYWEHKKEGIFPLDRDLNFPENNQSYLLSKWIQSGLVEQSYDKTLGFVHEILGIKIARRIPETLNKKVSKEVSQYYKEKAPFLEKEGEIIIATADCKGVAMVPNERPEQPKEETTRRGKGQKKKGLRKDSVVTSDYSINLTPRSPEDILKGLMSVNSEKDFKSSNDKNKKKNLPKNKRVVATMFGKEKAFQDLADRIKARDIEEKSDIFILIDGERALEKGLLSEFKNRKWKNRIMGICLDIIHVTEYLWEFGSALYGEKSCKRPVWVKKQLLSILNNKTGYVIGAMKQILTKNKKLSSSKRLRMEKVIRYLQNHKHMMYYKKYLEKGLPIASGVIEGACRSLVKDRMECAGMKWTKEGANSILEMRSVKQNGCWDNYWEEYIKFEKERLYKR